MENKMEKLPGVGLELRSSGPEPRTQPLHHTERLFTLSNSSTECEKFIVWTTAFLKMVFTQSGVVPLSTNSIMSVATAVV